MMGIDNFRDSFSLLNNQHLQLLVWYLFLSAQSGHIFFISEKTILTPRRRRQVWQ
jgi:hypothetical protein